MDAGYWTELLGPIYRDRRWLIAADVMAAAEPEIEFLDAVGAQRPLILTARPHIGAPAAEPRAEVVPVELQPGPPSEQPIMGFVRAFRRAITDPDPAVRKRVEEWDPGGDARALTDPFFTEGHIVGRATYGARPQAWLAFEDKTTVDELWDEAGIQRAPSRVVGLDTHELAAAAVALDWGWGTVWAADNREGWHGGGEYLRWVQDPSDAAPALSFFSTASSKVRVMPFLEGIPCSIHGIVLGSDVIAVRPIEMVVVAMPGTGRLQYAGAASVWDPTAEQRTEMREVARRVGALLHEVVDYQGIFTVDGVMTDVGFLPTELNPRFGAGLRRCARVIEGLHLAAVHRALIAGEPLAYRPDQLERLLVEGMDDIRTGSAFLQVPETPEAEIEVWLRSSGDDVDLAADRDDAHVTLRWAVGIDGGALLVRLLDNRLPRGVSVMPTVAASFRYAARAWPISVPALGLLPAGRAP